MVLSPDAYRPCISATTPRVSSVSTSVTVRRGLVTNRSIRAMTHAITSSTSSGYTVIQLRLSIIFLFLPGSELGHGHVLEEVRHRDVHDVGEWLGMQAHVEHGDGQ